MLYHNDLIDNYLCKRSHDTPDLKEEFRDIRDLPVLCLAVVQLKMWSHSPKLTLGGNKQPPKNTLTAFMWSNG